MAFINQGRHVGTVGLQDPETLTIVGNEVDPVGWVEVMGNFKIHTFTTTGVFEVTGSRPVKMDVLSIGGGGSAGGGGGGAGGMVEATQITLEPAIYDVIVGAGGSSGVGAATRGGDTVFRIQGDSNTNVGVPDAFGGGSGSIIGPNGSGSGGSGSGAGAGQGVAGQGFNGGSPGGPCPGGGGRATGGGGGAGSIGTNAGPIGGHAPCGGCSGGGPGGTGGSGRENDYRTGSDIFYAGGGAGSGQNLRPQAPDGSSIPGHGGGGSGTGNTNGVQNKGGGGAQQGIPRFPGNGFGGSGIIVIRAPFPARDGI